LTVSHAAHNLIHLSIHSPINTTITHFQLMYIFLQSLCLSLQWSVHYLHSSSIPDIAAGSLLSLLSAG